MKSVKGLLVHDKIKGYTAISLTNFNPPRYSIVDLIVDHVNRGYVTVHLSETEVNMECLEIVDAKGRVVKTDGIIHVEWVPLPGWGQSCEGVDWEQAYNNLKTIDH